MRLCFLYLYSLSPRKMCRIEFRDPVTRAKVSLRVTPDRLENAEPKNAVVSFVRNFDPDNIRGSGQIAVHVTCYQRF